MVKAFSVALLIALAGCSNAPIRQQAASPMTPGSSALNALTSGWILVNDFSNIPSLGYKVYRTPQGVEKIVTSGSGGVIGGDTQSGGNPQQYTRIYDKNYTLGRSMADVYDASGKFVSRELMK